MGEMERFVVSLDFRIKKGEGTAPSPFAVAAVSGLSC